jgi:RimJ/RimL family protein N-acetyltransferase
MTLVLRAMTLEDLPIFEGWLDEPHFATWFLQDSTVADELATNAAMIRGEDPATVLIAELDGRPIGWGQWYRWEWYPETAAAYGAYPGEYGIDYGIGEPDCIGRGLGTELVGLLVAEVPARASILAAPSGRNRPSCRALERNRFTKWGYLSVAEEPNASPLALYRREYAQRTDQ